MNAATRTAKIRQCRADGSRWMVRVADLMEADSTLRYGRAYSLAHEQIVTEMDAEWTRAGGYGPAQAPATHWGDVAEREGYGVN